MDVALVPLLTVALCVVVVCSFVVTRYSGSHAQLLVGALVAHLGAALVNLWLVLRVYGYGDLLMYHQYGSDLSEALSIDFVGVFPGIVQVLFQGDNPLSVYIPAEGSDVASMVALCSLVCFVFGNDLLATSLAYAVGSFVGKLALLQGFLESVPSRMHTHVLIGTMLVPSSVFWSSGIIKEAVVVPALGLYVLGLLRLVRGRTSGLAALIAGAVVVSLIKAYLMLILVGATGVYLYARRAFVRGQVTVRPLWLLVGIGVVVGGMMAVGEMFPRFSMERLAEETARLQAASLNPLGGSTYSIGDPGAATYVGQLAYVPQALFTGWFRPLIFEARNPQMLINGLETAGFLALSLYVVATRGLHRMARIVMRNPILAFCLAFAVVCGIATGLTSANLGTLSRYRMPLVPFLATALIVFVRTPVARPTGRWPSRTRPTVRNGSRGIR